MYEISEIRMSFKNRTIINDEGLPCPVQVCELMVSYRLLDAEGKTIDIGVQVK